MPTDSDAPTPPIAARDGDVTVDTEDTDALHLSPDSAYAAAAELLVAASIAESQRSDANVRDIQDVDAALRYIQEDVVQLNGAVDDALYHAARVPHVGPKEVPLRDAREDVVGLLGTVGYTLRDMDDALTILASERENDEQADEQPADSGSE